MSDRYTLTDTKQNLLQQSQTTGKNDTTTFLQQPFCALKNMQNFIKISKLTVYKMQVISFWSTLFKFTAQNNNISQFNTQTSDPFGNNSLSPLTTLGF